MNKLKHPLAIIILFILTIILTYPLAFYLNKYIPGFFSTDEVYGTIWDYWKIQQGNNIYKENLIAYPFGYQVSNSDTVHYLHDFLVKVLLKFKSYIFTYNIQVLANIFLSALMMYFLVFYLLASAPLALFAGIIFGFCPYQFVRSWQHLSLTYNQLIPITLLAFILLRNANSYKVIFFAITSIFLLFSFDYSIMYSTVIALAVFFSYDFFYDIKNKLANSKNFFQQELIYLKKVAIVGIASLILLLPQLVGIFKGLTNSKLKEGTFTYHSYHKDFNDLFVQSAKPFSYLLPASSHPIFGKFTEQFIGTWIYGVSFTEHTLYIGWTVIILAFIAFKRFWRNRKKKDRKISDRDYYFLGFFIWLAIISWLFSQAPWWEYSKLRIYMPSFLMYKILPMFRAYCRFGIVVMLAMAVLASLGLKYVLERFKSRIAKLLMISLFSGLVLFEFFNYPPYKVIDISKVPQVYYWLKDQPKDTVIAQYPLDDKSPNELYRFYQTIHRKPMINYTLFGTKANDFAKQIIDISKPKTASLLKSIGVKYVFINRDGFLNSSRIEDNQILENIPENSGLKLIKSFPQEELDDPRIMAIKKTGLIDVYEVVAK